RPTGNEDPASFCLSPVHHEPGRRVPAASRPSGCNQDPEYLLRVASGWLSRPRPAEWLFHGNRELLHKGERSGRGNTHVVAMNGEAVLPERADDRIPLEFCLDFHVDRFASLSNFMKVDPAICR